MATEVLLDAYVLPDDHSVFKFFPGEGYKFYDVIRDTGVAIIDIRQLEDISEDPSEWDDESVLAAITEDRLARAEEGGKDRPDRVVHSSGDKMNLTFLNGLLFKAKKGDLILMPQKGYTTEVLIGELEDDAGEVWTIEAQDDGTKWKYFGRRVVWVGSIEKRLFKRELIEQLQTPVAFFDVGVSNYDQVYRLAFDNYVYDQQYVGTIRTDKRIFTPKDNFLTSVWLEMLEVLEGARESGRSLPADMSIYELVIDSDISEDERDDLSISVQSPGWFRIRSQAPSPLASLALYALALAGVSYDEAVAATVSAKVVRQADDSCMGDVDASVRDYIRSLGRNRWAQACTLAKQADAEAKLKVQAQVRRSGSAKKEEN